MANHTAVKVGGWVFRDPIEADEITGIQERLLKCPNFDEGSTHAPSGDIILTDGGTAARNFAIRTSGELGSSVSHVWTLAGTLLLSGVLSVATGGRIRLPVGTFTMNSGQEQTISSGPMVRICTGLNSSDRVIQLATTGAQTGDLIFYINRDTFNTFTIADINTAYEAAVHPKGMGFAIYYADQWHCGGTG